jgi:hypothetical protein
VLVLDVGFTDTEWISQSRCAGWSSCDVLVHLAVRDRLVEVDEVTACLRYVAALGPLLAHGRGVDERGRLAIRASDPDVAVLIDIGLATTFDNG